MNKAKSKKRNSVFKRSAAVYKRSEFPKEALVIRRDVKPRCKFCHVSCPQILPLVSNASMTQLVCVGVGLPDSRRTYDLARYVGKAVCQLDKALLSCA